MTTPTQQISGMTDAEFDELSARVAAAFARGDESEGRALQDDLCVNGLVPHAQKRVRLLAHYASIDRADVLGEAIARVLEALHRGRPVPRAVLWSIYKGASADLANWAKRHEHRDFRKNASSDQALEDLIVRARAGEARPLRDLVADSNPGAVFLDYAETAAFNEMRDSVAADLATMQPKWLRPLWLAMCGGEFHGPTLATQLGITEGRVRSCKTSLRNYLLGIGRHLISNLDPEA